VDVEQLLNNVGNIPHGVRTFAVRTHVPFKWELDSEGGRHVKTKIIAEIVNYIKQRFHLTYAPTEGELIFTVDFVEKKVDVSLRNLYVFGYYYKEKKNVSQTRWLCPRCHGKGCEYCNYRGKMYVSVEELLGNALLPLFQAKDYALHASGREDVDVINLAGRPFVIEMVKPRRKPSIDEIRRVVQQPRLGVWADVKRFITPLQVKLITDSHFDKLYWVETDTCVDEEEVKVLEQLKTVIKQRTPTRVERRRADVVRERRVLNLTVLNRCPLVFTVEVEPGTYVKELVSGDNGRTRPSVAELLDRAVNCTELKVLDIYDEFLSDVLNVRRSVFRFGERFYTLKKNTLPILKHTPPHLKDTVERYVRDAEHFFNKGDVLSAIAAYDYVYGLVEGARLKKEERS